MARISTNTEKKEELLSCRITKEDKERFTAMCEDAGLTPSAALLVFVKQCLKEQTITVIKSNTKQYN